MMTKLALDGIKVVDFTGVHRLCRLGSWALRDEFAVGLLGFAGAPMDGSG
jgi:hypothetical protein